LHLGFLSFAFYVPFPIQPGFLRSTRTGSYEEATDTDVGSPGEPANRKLTIKQRKFIDGKLHGQSSPQAARNAGYSESVARKGDHIISHSPTVLAVFHEILCSAFKIDIGESDAIGE
jgi:hypothetical protein